MHKPNPSKKMRKQVRSIFSRTEGKMPRMIRSRLHPTRDRLMFLGIGLLGGALAGMGISSLTGWTFNRNMTLSSRSMDQNEPGGMNTHPHHTSTSSGRSSGSGARRSRTAGTNLASPNIETGEQNPNNPTTNDSLGG